MDKLDATQYEVGDEGAIQKTHTQKLDADDLLISNHEHRMTHIDEDDDDKEFEDA